MILLTAATTCVGACGGGCGRVPGSDPRGSTTTVTREPAMASQIESAAPQTLQIAIDNFTFTPAQLTVPTGSKVTWINHDDVPHTIVSTTKAFKSRALDTDDRFEHVFDAPGTYPYFCSVHPHMTAVIIVK
jgi:plastocyanin